jgi:hypothetical protein
MYEAYNYDVYNYDAYNHMTHDYKLKTKKGSLENK